MKDINDAGYVFPFGQNLYDPDGRANSPTTSTVEAHNAALERRELAVWLEKPERWYGYVGISPIEPGKTELTTWLGSTLGVIEYTSSFRNPLTGTRTTFVVIRGNNGARYHGRYGSDWSQLVRVCKYKER